MVESGGALGEFGQALIQRPFCGCSGRQDQQVARLVSGEECAGLFRSHGSHHARAPDLGLEHAHQDVANLVNHQALPGLPRLRPFVLGEKASNGILGGQRAIHVILSLSKDESVDPGGVGVEHHAGVAVHDVVVGLGAGYQAEAAHQLVLFQCAVADGLGPAAAASQAVVLHMPQPVLGGHKSLGEEGVVLVFGPHVGDAQLVAVYLHRGLQAVQGNRTGKSWNSLRQLGPANNTGADHGAHLYRDYYRNFGDDNTALGPGMGIKEGLEARGTAVPRKPCGTSGSYPGRITPQATRCPVSPSPSS